MTQPHVSLRAAIRARLAKLGWTANQLAQAVKGRVPRSVVYAFLAGTRDTCSENVDAMMLGVGLMVVEIRRCKDGQLILVKEKARKP